MQMGELLGLPESAAWHCRLGLLKCAGEMGAFLALASGSLFLEQNCSLGSMPCSPALSTHQNSGYGHLISRPLSFPKNHYRRASCSLAMHTVGL